MSRTNLLAVTALFLFTFSGCEEAAATSYRKEFRIAENSVQFRLEHYFAFHKRYPEELTELEEPGPTGYKLPRIPKGCSYAYDNQRGRVRVRVDALEKDSEE